jgi:hypothetical protein
MKSVSKFIDLSILLPFNKGVKSISHDKRELATLHHLINNNWNPSLSVIGIEGLPSIQESSNEIIKDVTARCSLRLPPTLNKDKAIEII